MAEEKSTNAILFRIGDLIDNSMVLRENAEKMRRFNDRKPTKGVRVSEGTVAASGEVFGACLRKMYYRMSNQFEPKPTDIYGVRCMGLGRFVEEWDQDELEHIGILKGKDERRFRVNNPYCDEMTIGGEVDSLITIPNLETLKNYNSYESAVRLNNEFPEDSHIVVEHKTTYGYGFERDIQGTKIKDIGKPKVSHVFQLAVYLDQYPKLSGLNIPYGKLYYTGRGYGRHKEFDIVLVGENKTIWIATHPATDKGQTFSPEFIPYNPHPNPEVMMNVSVNDIYKRWAKLYYEYLIEGILPPRDYQHVYDSARITNLRNMGIVSKSKYDKFVSGEKIGDWQCRVCDYKEQCLKNKNIEPPIYREEEEEDTNKKGENNDG